ncbi:MAG: hypothetical protein JO340_19165 [Acidobacteriaceae bacterium]|nr:hypothetical protein [Acidobacteriaceae bacterium]
MIRAAYRGLLWLHPAEFEERFAEEMLWIFDLKRPRELGAALLLDCFVSLFRQWIAYPPVRIFAIGLLVNYALALCSAVYVWMYSPKP